MNKELLLKLAKQIGAGSLALLVLNFVPGAFNTVLLLTAPLFTISLSGIALMAAVQILFFGLTAYLIGKGLIK